MREEPEAGDPVVRRFELEEERLSRTKTAETTPTSRLPEVDLVDFPLLRQESEPVIVCDSDVPFHGIPADLNTYVVMGRRKLQPCIVNALARKMPLFTAFPTQAQ
ncbi:MAG TPA: hypothetical protein EYP19_05100 [Desulfobacterales bacterium]|nr:hypothetical protein [Desulfobacterales bacterium]